MLSRGANFFECVKSIVNNDNLQAWNPCDMYPDKNELEVAETFADYFNGISCEYEPASFNDVPKSYSKPLPLITEDMIVQEVKKGKKSKSTVEGDIYINILSDYALVNGTRDNNPQE